MGLRPTQPVQSADSHAWELLVVEVKLSVLVEVSVSVVELRVALVTETVDCVLIVELDAVELAVVDVPVVNVAVGWHSEQPAHNVTKGMNEHFLSQV
jgi:hypothetical protein